MALAQWSRSGKLQLKCVAALPGRFTPSFPHWSLPIEKIGGNGAKDVAAIGWLLGPADQRSAASPHPVGPLPQPLVDPLRSGCVFPVHCSPQHANTVMCRHKCSLVHTAKLSNVDVGSRI